MKFQVGEKVRVKKGVDHRKSGIRGRITEVGHMAAWVKFEDGEKLWLWFDHLVRRSPLEQLAEVAE